MIKKILNKVLYIRKLREENFKLQKENKYLFSENANFQRNCAFPPGHFYSVLVSVDDAKKRELEIWKKEQTEVPGIDLQIQNQVSLINSFIPYYAELPFSSEKQDSTRYYYVNDYYCHTDSILLYSMIRHYKPKSIIEIGSGFSSAVMLDTNEFFFNNGIHLTFIEPYPERLYSLITDNDKKRTVIIEKNIQSVPLEEFKQLTDRDILFVDSTHVVKTGGDVNYILFEILPALQPGVLIHFHDIHYPFEYPKNWVMEGRNWNETYFLKAFLMYNNQFEIKLFNTCLHQLHKEVFKDMPLCYKNQGSSLWLQKK